MAKKVKKTLTKREKISKVLNNIANTGKTYTKAELKRLGLEEKDLDIY
jgi:hypothetical protein